MPTKQVRPSTIEGIKRLAKRIASEKALKHTAALDEAARVAGYQTFLHAKRSLAPKRERAPPQNARITPPMTAQEFQAQARSVWANTINTLADEGDVTLTWDSIDDIVRVLTPFMGSSKNHTHFPTGGGFDLLSVRRSREAGCIEFQVFTGSAVVAKPRRLVLERLESDPTQSFMMLELDDLHPVLQREEEPHVSGIRRRQEELIDLGGADYVERGSVYEDDLPESARKVLRLLNGQLLLVTKGSIWNGSSRLYNGVHDTVTHTETRNFIQEVSDRIAAA